VATRTIAPNYLPVVLMTQPNPDKFHQEQNTTLVARGSDVARLLIFGWTSQRSELSQYFSLAFASLALESSCRRPDKGNCPSTQSAGFERTAPLLIGPIVRGNCRPSFSTVFVFASPDKRRVDGPRTSEYGWLHRKKTAQAMSSHGPVWLL